MISRGSKKKAPNSPTKNTNTKKKSKSKSKEKPKKFNANDFLQALIDLQNTNCSTNKKKRNTGRDLSSALTSATPALQTTISATKIRSRSSFSQYRKKSNLRTNQPLTLNFCAIITEEDNIQYTDKTARSSYFQEQNNNITHNQKEKENNTNIINKNVCATKIQRAWRNFQTYKMVNKIFLKQKKKKQSKHKQNSRVLAPQLHIKLNKTDMQKTLKIKKQHIRKKEQFKQDQFDKTQKIFDSSFKSNKNEKEQNKSPIMQVMWNTDPQSRAIQNCYQDDIIKIKQKQAQRFNQIIQLISNQRQHKSKQQLLQDLVSKFQQNKKTLQNDINNQLQCIQFPQENMQQDNNISSSNLDKKQKQQIQKINQNLDSINASDLASSESSMCFDYESMADEMPEFKIFQQRLKIIKQNKFKKLEKIDQSLMWYNISSQQAAKRKQIVYYKYQKQKKQIQKNKKQFLFSLTQLKKNALKCHKQILNTNLSLSRIKKCFSVGNTVLKQVLSDIKLTQIENDGSQRQFQYLFKRDPDIKRESSHTLLTTTPVLQASPSLKNEDLSQNLVDKNNTQVMKVYSQQVQQLIQKQLIDEFIKSIFTDDKLFIYFRPYVQQIYQFKKIQDSQVFEFISRIKKYFPSQTTMLQRANQKINPTSLQILKIIRDIDYYIENYQLIIPQECFKKYRTFVEQEYQNINANRKVNSDQIVKNVKDFQMIEKVLKIQAGKKQKMKKYSNFQRDLKMMYMKSVFNCMNQLLIQTKASNAYMNGRSSIGPGQLSLAIKQFNQEYSLKQYQQLIQQIQSKLINIIGQKCSIPSFKNYHDVEAFQRQVMKQIQIQSNQGQFKWVNFMDEVLQIWQDLCVWIVQFLLSQAINDILTVFK